MPKKHEYEGGEPIGPNGNTKTIEITKAMVLANNFETLEHIDVRVWINHTRRGDVSVELVSPNGIKSALAQRRKGDDAKTGFPGWRFMTIKHWYIFCYFDSINVFELYHVLTQGGKSYRELDH